MKLKSKLTIGITLLAVVLGAGMIFQSYQSPAVGAATQLVAGQTFFLAGSGISSTATSFTLTSFTIPQNSYAILDGDVSETFYVTLEPGSRQRQEIVSCTTVVQKRRRYSYSFRLCQRSFTYFSIRSRCYFTVCSLRRYFSYSFRPSTSI